jgi:hypothetical protein
MGEVRVGEITSIDVPKLHKVGDSVREVSGQLGKLKDRLYTMEYHSGGAIEGSLTSESSLGVVAMHWSYTFENLAKDVQQYAANLHQAADGYQRSDEEASVRLKESGHPAFAPGGEAAF